MNTHSPTYDIIPSLDDLNGERCYIYQSSGSKLLAHGSFVFRQGSSFRKNIEQYAMVASSHLQKDTNECRLALKQITKELKDGIYKVIVLTQYDDNKYALLEIEGINWENKRGYLETKVPIPTLSIQPITKDEYIEISKTTYEFDWSKLNVPPGCSGTKQSDAFEDLINELILHSKDIVNYARIGTGVDRARDGQFEINMASWLPKVNASTRWILQCKYSVDKNTSLAIDEIYSEMIKVLMHKPDYYLLVTNRKITSDFLDWFNSDLMLETNYFIPYKKILIQREELEELLVQPEYIHLRKKFFG
ncbi:hypothetical protein ABER99_21335 [Paenibacillus glucanolyticus]|jgi:phage pi2 protein 07|uniref:Restriction endonuclease type IV Mrr domain-containing protein n=1 Tax=Paenibacillus glucanolyticus TaxID=59843 RepID=A0A163G6I3_9BACL|nr:MULTISPECIES: hypothetical protein [Paenibacillus]KZS44761.1 hypothetical protein AWU65_01860 [Paenibacillus glucanolyticus]MDH6675646.1 phage pi2 protein 07 [Paenibacillus sp. LBL]OMF64752.1 hypothetical protein BK142_31695 [Paenibacillus glucanolyticus]